MTRMRIIHRESKLTLRQWMRANPVNARCCGHDYVWKPHELDGRTITSITNEQLTPGFLLAPVSYGDSGGPYWLRHEEFEVQICTEAEE